MSNENDPFHPHSLYQKIISANNAVGGSHFSNSPEIERDIKLIPNPKISPAKFKPHSFLVYTYEAHPQTIRAVRKELFSAGDEHFIDLESLYHCNCGHEVDQQFWFFCPHCGASFKANGQEQ